MLRSLADWLAATPLSVALQARPWTSAMSESVHIVALSGVFFSAILINSRLLGLGRGGRSISQLTQQLTPWIWRGLAVLLLTGAVQIMAEPVRVLVNPVFWAKMALLVAVVLMSAGVTRAVGRNAERWDAAALRPAGATAFAWCSTLLWVAIVICGRMIVYVSSAFL